MARNYNIAFVIQDITTRGGTERTTCCLANEFSAHGHTVSVISIFNNMDKPTYTLDKNINVIFLCQEKYGLNFSLTVRLKKTMFAAHALKRCATLQDADIIISQKLLASLAVWRAGFGHKTFACEHFRYGMYNKPVRFLRNMLYNRMSILVTLTENDMRRFKAAGVKRVCCIPNMVSVVPQKQEGQNSRRIISVGRLDPQKGYDMLLDALQLIKDKIADWKIDIYGEGNELSNLITQRDRAGLSLAVSFRGYTPDIVHEYAHSAFYVMSPRFEGFPMVLLEAAACGLPIVSFRCPEGPETLLAKGGGILVENGNIEKLAAAILTMATDNKLREKYAEETQRIIQEYSPENIYSRWIDLITSI